MQAEKRPRTKKRRAQPSPKPPALEDELSTLLLAGQVCSLSRVLVTLCEGLGWHEPTPKERVQSLTDLVDIVAEKSSALLALMEAPQK